MSPAWRALAAALALAALPAAGSQEGLARWFDPTTAPFIPVPEIDLDPNAGTTVGLIPTWLQTDSQGQIRRIWAPDVIYNPYFGWGARARVFDFGSADTQWSVVGGAKERVESEFDAQYISGRERATPLSYSLQLLYDRSGTARFYGVGNETHSYDETVYTDQQQYFGAQAGWNLSHAWQLAWYLSPREVTITGGQLDGIPSTDERFPHLPGLGTTREFLNRLLVTYDTRDDPTIPRRGGELVLYGALASRCYCLNDSLYSETGGDARFFWSPDEVFTWAFHGALRYLPSVHQLPFWALSTLGGDANALGGAQLLRGFGAGRFSDRNAFSASVEMRARVADFDAVSTHIQLQLTPFIDTGSVFRGNGDSPLAHLHNAIGVGIRALARPFVVGYLDVGKGSEGVVAFSGINYPF